jgi:hypothetical protein
MSTHLFALVFHAPALAGLLTCGTALRADDVPPQGVDVLTRGPVHEAYAQAVDVTPAPTPVVPKQPPPPIEEVPPDQKPAGDNVQWIPGYWAWDQDQSDFIWVSGIWRSVPPDRQWVPGHWQQVQGGWQWVPGLWLPVGQTDLQIVPTPPASLDQGPSTPAPDATSTYVPGCWVYQDNRYMWRPGFWVSYHPGWVWTPAHYVWSPSGSVFVDGFWDYPLESRGLLFAPVRIDRRLLGQPNWRFTPHYVVSRDSLLETLFVGPSLRHYYFGDYFDARYRKLGYVPWMDYRINQHNPDPLYSYYRHRPDGDRWERELRDLHAARQRNQSPLPRTLVEQNRAIQDLRRDKSVTNAAINHVTVVHSLGQTESHGIKLGPVPKEHQEQVRKSAEWYHQVQQQRQAYEARFVHNPPAAAERPAPVGTMRLPPSPHPAPAPVRTPPAPAVPKHVEKPR